MFSRVPASSPSASPLPMRSRQASTSSPVAPTCTSCSSTCATAPIDGQQAQDLLHEVGITVNRNAVPFDPRPPMVTSGVRIGTPALATRGFGAAEFTEVSDVIATALKGGADIEALRARVKKLTDAFPLYPGLAQ